MKSVKSPPSRNDLIRLFMDITTAEDERIRTKQVEFQSALHPQNRFKNRYSDILPFEHNRVQSDLVPYINASHVTALDNMHYIVAQGPLSHTVRDFWLTVVQESCRLLVMLCNPVEKNTEKCAQYWPQSLKDPLRFDSDGLLIRLISTENLEQIKACRREIQVDFAGNPAKKVQPVSFKCVQMHYTGWPDHGVPDEADDFLRFLMHARQYLSDEGKALVHCSAGVGRSGTFIAVNTLINAVERNLPIESHDPVNHCVHHLRRQRLRMVESFVSKLHDSFNRLFADQNNEEPV